MKLPFSSKEKFIRLPGERPMCYGVFKKEEIESLLENSSKSVLSLAARFLNVPEVKIVQGVTISQSIINITFAEKNDYLYDEGGEDY